MKLDLDDNHPNLVKVEIFKNVEEVESDEEKKYDDTPILASEVPKLRESFIVTKSIAVPLLNEEKEEEFKDEEIKEEPIVAEDLEDDLDDDENLPELEPEGTFIKNPLRQSLSSSFWLKKSEENNAEQVGLFKYEPIVSEPWHIPKIIDIKKKKATDVQSEINDMKKQLQNIGVLSIPKHPKYIVNEDIPEIVIEKEILEEIVVDTPEDIPEDIKIESPANLESEKKSKKERKEEKNTKKNKNYLKRSEKSHKTDPGLENLEKKYDSPYTKNNLAESKSYVGFSLSESSFSNSTKITKDQYKQGFMDLKKSLQEVDSYFSGIDNSDPEYSVSFEESYQERRDILNLLMSISEKLGEKLAFSQENELLEKFSKKLVTSFEKKIRKRERKKEMTENN